MHLGIKHPVRIVRRIRYQLLLDTHRENGSALQARVVIGRRGVRGPGGGTERGRVSALISAT